MSRTGFLLLSCMVALMIALGHVRGAQSEAVYPFEVRVGGEPAKYEGGVFAKIAAPCPPDAVLEVPSATEMVIINVFPVAADGTVAADAGSHTKVLLIPSGTKVRLNETTDRSTLAPGLYGANVVTGQRTSRIMFSIK